MHFRRPRVYYVNLQGNRIVFGEKVNSKAHRDYMFAAYDGLKKGYKELTLDFEGTEKAYSDGMIPILCSLDQLRREGIVVNSILPSTPEMFRLFVNTNWAHFLSPSGYPPTETTHDRHLSVKRFKTFEEQQSVVNEFIDVVMRNLRLERDVIAGLEWSINEITDNVLNHASSDDGGLVQVTTYSENRTVAFTVGDSGRGILSSMRQAFPHLPDDTSAIGEAVKAGVTGNSELGQGNGLAGTLRIATLSGGQFAITSGQGQMVVMQDGKGGIKTEQFRRGPQQRFTGTLVSATLGISGDFHLTDALGFNGRPYHPVDIIETKYETEDGRALVLQMKDETTGFGTRQSGRQIRTKCLNLLTASPSVPLVVDWLGVPLISSSFADESIGKLFVELGPLGFSSRVRSINMEAVVAALIDKAIMERMVQNSTFRGSTPPDIGEDWE